MGQKEVLHLLPAEVDLVLVVPFDRLGLVHGIIQRQQELLKALHDGRRWTQIHVVDVPEPEGWRSLGLVSKAGRSFMMFPPWCCLLPRLDGDAMMRLHEVHVRVAPVLRGAIAGPSSSSTSSSTITQVISSTVRVCPVVIPDRDR